jgi:hypothetical protein
VPIELNLCTSAPLCCNQRINTGREWHAPGDELFMGILALDMDWQIVVVLLAQFRHKFTLHMKLTLI